MASYFRCGAAYNYAISERLASLHLRCKTGAIGLASNLQKNADSALTILYLWGNAIGNAGGKAFGELFGPVI
jgi:hypothetical protein